MVDFTDFHIIYCPVCTTNDEADAETVKEPFECDNCESVYTVGDTPLVTTMEVKEFPAFTGAILFCPTCCDHHDATQWGVAQYHCGGCSTDFTVNLIPERVAEYSRYG